MCERERARASEREGERKGKRFKAPSFVSSKSPSQLKSSLRMETDSNQPRFFRLRKCSATPSRSRAHLAHLKPKAIDPECKSASQTASQLQGRMASCLPLALSGSLSLSPPSPTNQMVPSLLDSGSSGGAVPLTSETDFRGNKFQFKNLLAMRFTTQHDLY